MEVLYKKPLTIIMIMIAFVLLFNITYAWDNCYDNSYGDAYSKVCVDDPIDKDGYSWNPYYWDYAMIRVQCTGDKFYAYEDLGSWNDVNCDQYGCYDSGQDGFFLQLAGTGYPISHQFVSISGSTDLTEPMYWAYVCWDKNSRYWTWAGYGWVNGNFNFDVVECRTNNHCSSDEICDNHECVEGSVCQETDDGKDYYTKGTCTDNTGSYTDECTTDNSIAEYYCLGGACYIDYVTNLGGACEDGHFIDCNSHDYSACYQDNVYWFDSCNNVEEIKEQCDYGCLDGECTIYVECTDTDGGKEYGLKGTCSDSTGSGTDTCSSDGSRSILWEYYCDGNLCALDGPIEGNCVDGALVTCSPHDHVDCYDGNVYWFDSCGEREELQQQCPEGCTDGVCNTNPCIPHSEMRCDNNDVYWFDSCGNKEELVQDCGTKTCTDGVCQGGGNGTCVPYNMRCDNDLVQKCNEAGDGWDTEYQCSEGTKCVEKSNTYATCEAENWLDIFIEKLRTDIKYQAGAVIAAIAVIGSIIFFSKRRRR